MSELEAEIERLRAENEQQRALLEAKSLRNWQNETEIETLRAENERLTLRPDTYDNVMKAIREDEQEMEKLRANALTAEEAQQFLDCWLTPITVSHPALQKLQRIANQNLGSNNQ